MVIDHIGQSRPSSISLMIPNKSFARRGQFPFVGKDLKNWFLAIQSVQDNSKEMEN